MFNKKHFDHRLDMLELYLTVRDPGTAKAADAYDGLRKTLIKSNKGMQVHLAQLAELHRVASAADSLEPVQAKLREYMSQVGLLPIDDLSYREFFEFTGGKGTMAVVDSPAYVSVDESGEPTLVMRGVAHHENGPSADSEPRMPSDLEESEGEAAGVATPAETPVTGRGSYEETEGTS